MNTLPTIPPPCLPALLTHLNVANLTSWPPTTIATHGTLILGPSRDESEILQTCCPAYDSALLRAADGTPCLRPAACDVGACAAGDPGVACVERLRGQWGVGGGGEAIGVFECLPGRGSAASRLGGKRARWVVAVLWIIVGVGAWM